MIDVPQILTEVARVVATVEGMAGCSYPMEDAAQKSPWGFVLWGSQDQETEIRYEMGSEVWVVPFVVRVAVKHVGGETAAEMLTVDRLLGRIQARFSPIDGTRPNDVLTLPGHIDQLRVASLRPGLTMALGGQEFYAGDAGFRLMYRRVRDE